MSRDVLADCVLGLQLFSQMPDVSLECASNVVHLRLCRDSCVALCDLLLYLSSQRDLSPPPIPQQHSPLAMRPSHIAGQPGEKEGEGEGEGEEKTVSIGDLISDAMEDASPTGVAKVPSHFLPRPCPGEAGVRVSGSGDALLMEFDSDSEGERDHTQTSSSPTHTPISSTVGRRMMDSLFSDSDEDDFCIVATPTSTRVVNVGGGGTCVGLF